MLAINNKLIESGFPFESLSVIAEQESWRKEINRPASYIHKWWARRLGSVFRGLIIGGFEDSTTNFFDKFYSDTFYHDKIVFDPFMGSGTTVHETLKLGATAIGCDINPVASAIVKTASDIYSKDQVIKIFNTIKDNCSNNITKFYKSVYKNKQVDTLYYFWIKIFTCPHCGYEIPLFKSTIFSKYASVAKRSDAKSFCPYCMHINDVLYNDINVYCKNCKRDYNPQNGNVKNKYYFCPICKHHEHIIDYIRRSDVYPSEKMYAKLILDDNGDKIYLETDDYDLELYNQAKNLLSRYEQYILSDDIHNGINTDQILNYNYKKCVICLMIASYYHLEY